MTSKFSLQFCLFVTFVSSARLNLYRFPEVSLKAFSPKGLQVTLPFTPGDHSFSFHANINEAIDSKDIGQIFGQTVKKSKNQWLINNFDIRLKPGDKVYYWVYVQHGKLGYRNEGQCYEIKDIESIGGDEDNESVSVTPSTKPNISSSMCARVISNLTENYLHLQEQLASVKETNKILADLVQKDPKLSTILTLDGVAASEENLTMLVQAILREKMELPSCLVADVVRKPNGRIHFRVGSLEEKLQVIEAAKTKLKNSRYIIMY